NESAPVRVRTPVRLPAKALHWSVSHDATVARRVVTALAAGSSPRRSGRLRDPRLAWFVPPDSIAASRESFGPLDTFRTLKSPGTPGAFFYSLCFGRRARRATQRRA